MVPLDKAGIEGGKILMRDFVAKHKQIVELEETIKKLARTSLNLYKRIHELEEQLGLLEDPVSPTD